MPHAEQRISAIIDPYLMFIENIAVSHSRRIYLNSRRLIVVLETCRYVKRYINAFVKIALSYRSLNENLTTLLRREISEHYRDDFRKWLVKKKVHVYCTKKDNSHLTEENFIFGVLNQKKNKCFTFKHNTSVKTETTIKQHTTMNNR